MLDALFNAVFGPLMKLIPEPFNLLVISFLLTFIITLIYKWMTNQEMMKSLKTEIKELQSEMKSSKDDHQKVMGLQKKAMEKNMKYMLQSFKPMLVTFIPIIFIFSWLRNFYTSMGNPTVLNLGFMQLGWLGSYIVFSIILSILLRKVMKVY